MAVTLYGIPNCDTVKKARTWLDAHQIACAFHDYKKHGADAAQVARWVQQAGLEKVLNKAGTTFRKLDEAQKADLTVDKAVALMVAQPSLIKRPIVEYPRGLLIGFIEPEWVAMLAPE
ncbi:arsenate reductase [Novosphingobium sp.]|uniref:arsenate reductase n=1 Tax=Novosphingobium sp. TaxID=1874826 RepID=UPI002B479936|nr:arsenate reductase [Novosphingobium sp.]HKR92191.1 arsenate reductase [Novosphingobium sp.]